MTDWLHHHLTRDHNRAWPEIAGLSLADVHGLEHAEQEMGFAELDHRHSGENPARRFPCEQ